MPKDAGRPSKLTPELREELLENIELGMTYKLASQAVGITYRTFRNWVMRGEDAKSGEYFEFVQLLGRAHAKGAQSLLMLIRRSANDGDARSAQWILERRHREDYGPPDIAAALELLQSRADAGSDFLRGADTARALYEKKKKDKERA